MKNACEKWKDQLLDAVLTGTTAKPLEEHLRSCANCSAELRKVRAGAARLDELLPLVAQREGPSADFRARVLAAAEAASEGKPVRPWRMWTLAATAVIAGALIVGLTLLRRGGPKVPEDALAAAQKLAEWRAPSDGLLVTPGHEILETMPRLGKSYLNVPVKTDEEE